MSDQRPLDDHECIDLAGTENNVRLLLADRQARIEREAALVAALTVMLNRYTSLVNCGDCGNWNPEEESEVIQARAALLSKPSNKDKA